MKGELVQLQALETPLLKSEKLSKLANCNVFVKNESFHPTRTIKHRMAKHIVQKALDEKIDRIAVFWLGNTAKAIANLANQNGIETTIIAQKNPNPKLKKDLQEISTIVEGIDLEKEFLTEQKMIEITQIGNEKVLPAINVWPSYYSEIVKEITQRVKPDYIICPLGSGSLFLGLWLGLKECNLQSTKIVGATLHEKNPFSQSSGKHVLIDDKKWLINFKAKSIADKLAQPYAGFEKEVKNILNEGHSIAELKEPEIEQAFDFVNNDLCISSEPSACAAFAVLPKMKFTPKQNVIVINTGNGYADKTY